MLRVLFFLSIFDRIYVCLYGYTYGYIHKDDVKTPFLSRFFEVGRFEPLKAHTKHCFCGHMSCGDGAFLCMGRSGRRLHFYFTKQGNSV